MAELTIEAQDLALHALFDGAMVGLTRGGEEISDAGYQRQPLLAGEPRSIGDAGLRVVTNLDAIRFGTWTATAPGLIDGWAVYSAAGVLLATGDFPGPEGLQDGDTDPRLPRRGQVPMMGPGAIVLGWV